MNESTAILTAESNSLLSWLAGFGSYAWLFRLIAAVVLVLIGLVGARAFRALFGILRKQLTSHMPEWVQILLDGFIEPVILYIRCLFWYCAFLAVPWPTDWVVGLTSAASTLLSIVTALLLTRGLWNSARLCSLLLRSTQNRLDLDTNKTMNMFFEKIYRALVFLFGCIQILTILGFDVNALIAGAGVVGIAISLGAQSTLSNLIAGVALVIERPFGIGDWIVLGSFEGAVEDISFRSTRIRALDNSVITVENSKVSSEYICNATTRSNRLFQCTIGLTYDTPREKLVKICADLKEMMNADDQVITGSAEATLSSFGASSIDIDARCYVTALGGTEFRAMTDKLNWKIMDLVAADGCEFAFPSTTVYLARNEDSKA